MAVYTPIPIAATTLAVTTEVTLYTVPAATMVIVKEIIISNVSLAIVNFGLSMHTTALRVFPDQALLPSSITVLDLSQVLAVGDLITAKCSAINSVTCFISGVSIV